MSVAQEVENLKEKLNWHWRNSMRTVRFGPFDARASLPIPILFFYIRWSTIALTIGFLVLFRFLERRGLTFPAALRNFRSWLVGKERPGWTTAEAKRFTDYG